MHPRDYRVKECIVREDREKGLKNLEGGQSLLVAVAEILK